MKDNIPKIIRQLLVFFICAFISLILIVVNDRFVKNFDDLIYNLILTIAVTVLSTALIFSITEMLNTNHAEEILNRNFSVLKVCHRYGLIDIYDHFPFTNEDIEDDFINSKKIYIIMNDAKSFISSNIPLMEKRIAKNGAYTTFVLQDYSAPDTMSALTRKNGHVEDPDYYAKKIKNTIEYHIKSLFKKKNRKHTINLFLNRNYNTLSIILMDNYALVSTYRISPGKTRVPHFVFQRGGIEYEDTLKDVEKIVETLREVPLDEIVAV